MEIKFENRYVPMYEDFLEYYTKASRSTKIARIEGFVIGIMFLIGLWITIWYGMSFRYIAVMIMGIVGSITMLFWHIIGAKKGYNGLSMIGLSGKYISIKFFANVYRISYEGQEGYKDLEYKDIKRIVEGNNCIFILLGKEMVVTLRKDGFIKGDKASFMKFMTEKISDSNN